MRALVLILLWLSPLLPAPLSGQAAPDRALTVGTKEAPPFSFRGPDGAWRGVSIELWDEIAAELGIEYELREVTLEELIDGLQAGGLDVSVAALTVTAERESVIDFTHPFYTSGLGIAVSEERKSSWLAFLEAVFSPAFLQALASLAFVLLVAGLLVWLFERRGNPEQFGGVGLKGLGAGFWWSAVTMTTVGYGDKAPQTLGGRIVALVWMFTSIIIISGFTAAIASTLTLSQLGSPVDGPEDLPRVSVATVDASTSADYLSERGISRQTYPTPEAALEALAAGAIDAAVYDAPILRYLALTRVGSVRVLPRTFQRQDYAIALPDGSELREPISRILLRRIGERAWQDKLTRYMGDVDR
jgi:ABC-type amino acid transport substrate-binding protein